MVKQRYGLAVALFVVGVLVGSAFDVPMRGQTQQTDKALTQQSSSQALALAHKLNEHLDAMQATNNPQQMITVFADDAVRMDPNRVMIRGKDAIFRQMMNSQKKPVQVLSAKSTAMHAWQTENMLFEYGTVAAQIQMGDGTIVDDPTNFFLAWVANPAAPLGYSVQFSIWNTSRPVEQLKLLSSPQ